MKQSPSEEGKEKISIQDAMLKHTDINLEFDNDENLLEQIQDYLISLGNDTPLMVIDAIITKLQELEKGENQETLKQIRNVMYGMTLPDKVFIEIDHLLAKAGFPFNNADKWKFDHPTID